MAQKQFMTDIAADSVESGAIPFDLYASDHDGRLIKICKAGTAVAGSPRNLSIRRERIFYIASKDLDLYLDYAYHRLENIVANLKIRICDKAKIAYQICRRVVRQIFDNPRSSEVVSQAERVVDAYIDLILSSPEAPDYLFTYSASDSYIFSHSTNVCILCLLIGAKILGRDRKKLQELGLGALLLDIGKTQVDPEIICKPSRLTDEEMKEVRKHATYSYELIKSHDLPKAAQLVGLHHHERSDGSGYPKGLKESETHIFARIAAVVDTYDAMTSHRVYGHQKPNLRALSEIAEQIHLYDAKVFNALLGVVLRNEKLITKFLDKYMAGVSPEDAGGPMGSGGKKHSIFDILDEESPSSTGK